MVSGRRAVAWARWRQHGRQTMLKKSVRWRACAGPSSWPPRRVSVGAALLLVPRHHSRRSSLGTGADDVEEVGVVEAGAARGGVARRLQRVDLHPGEVGHPWLHVLRVGVGVRARGLRARVGGLAHGDPHPSAVAVGGRRLGKNATEIADERWGSQGKSQTWTFLVRCGVAGELRSCGTRDRPSHGRTDGTKGIVAGACRRRAGRVAGTGADAGLGTAATAWPIPQQ